ncbi:hypothetical protein CEP51_012613 [Fusarium floridanum]|uniref:Uncharacterized protein n=1 Tax=Fusarium floridanum TaxID=1325733 RepID=A0A428QRC6_9HYPO|nr:hypothetical protein CEP51_012613 [Fusarium floridanum]
MSNPFYDDPALYIFTSLTAGSSHIVTATSRLETILRANRIPFKAVDIAFDDKARQLWGRRAGKDESGRVRKFPGLVQEGWVIGDIVEIEEWNEYGELKEHVKIYYDEKTIPSIHDKLPDPPLKKPIYPNPVPTQASQSPVGKAVAAAAAAKAAAPKAASAAKPKAAADTKKEEKTLPVRSVADEAAQKAKDLRSKALREKVHGKDAAKPAAGKAGAGKATPKTPVKASPAKATPSSSKTDGLQSPTSSSWTETDAAKNAVQSPTSGTWKESAGSLSSLKGATVSAASKDEIKAVEAKTAIKEEPELEKKAEKKDSDDDSDDDDDSDEEEDEEEDDDDDDDDDDDSDDDDDEKEAKKPAAAEKDKPKDAKK